MFFKLPAYPLKNHPFSVFLGKSENPDLADVQISTVQISTNVQIGTTHAKINIFSKV